MVRIRLTQHRPMPSEWGPMPVIPTPSQPCRPIVTAEFVLTVVWKTLVLLAAIVLLFCGVLVALRLLGVA